MIEDYGRVAEEIQSRSDFLIAFYVKTNTGYSEFDIFKMTQPFVDEIFSAFSVGF